MDDQMIVIGYGLRVVIDRTQVFPDDPGNGTPVMVYDDEEQASATYTCACGERELLNKDFVVTLSEEQAHWLQSLADDIDEFLGW